jgi:hypothetical protein
VPPAPHDPSSGGLDPESEKWWEELAWLSEADREELARRAPHDREFARAARRRERSARRSRRGGERIGRRASRSLLTFFALLVVAAGAISLAERGWEQAREASFAEGGHLDGTTIQGTDGNYAFLSTQRGSKEPVTYGPCRSVEVQINSSGEVPGGSQLVLDAMSRVSELSGLELAYSGPTSERPDTWSDRMTTGGLEAYPPVLVSWSDEDETPGLAGDVVGLGGSISLRGGDYARERYMTGSVTLDGPDLDEIAEGDDGEAKVRAVILHEFGHLVGLGHVQDPRELMSEANSGQLDFGPGDREGLARLGSGEC